MQQKVTKSKIRDHTEKSLNIYLSYFSATEKDGNGLEIRFYLYCITIHILLYIEENIKLLLLKEKHKNVVITF